MSGNDEFKAYFKVKNNADFRMRFADRAYRHCYKNGVLTDANAGAVWDSLCSFIEKAILCEIARWGDERGYLYDYDHWYKEWQDVKNDIHGRANRLITALKSAKMYPSTQPPQFLDGSQEIRDVFLRTKDAFQLTIRRRTSSDLICYTLDGNDPRTWDLSGNVSQTARQVDAESEDITIYNTSVIKARSKNGNVWSPLVELTIESDTAINPTGIEITENDTKDIILFQNYPNPFHSSTIIKYSLQKPNHTTLKVYNLVGIELETLVNDFQTVGEHEITWQPKELSGGIYFCRLQVGKFSKTIKLILHK
jgi:hypothetical protein